MDCRQLNRWLNGEDFPMPPIQAEAGTEDARDVIASALPLIISHDVDKIIAALHAAGYKIICHDRTKTNPTMG